MKQAVFAGLAVLFAALVLTRADAAGGGDKGKAVQSKQPLVHAVFFYLKKDAPASAVDDLIEDAHQLLKPIATVRNLWVGRPAGKSKSEKAGATYQVGLLVTFDSREALQTYADHPLHLKFVEKHKKYFDSVKVYDFINQPRRKAAPNPGGASAPPAVPPGVARPYDEKGRRE